MGSEPATPVPDDISVIGRKRRNFGARFALAGRRQSQISGSAVMKWFALNALGGFAWLVGLFVAKTAAFPTGNIFLAPDAHLLTGLSMGALGLVVLMWANLRTSG